MFKLIKIENGRQNVPEPDYLDVKSAEAVTIGEALVLSSGKLTKATGTPQFIAMGEVSANDTDRNIAVCRVESNQIFEAPITAAPTSLNVGDKVTLADTGLGVTATTQSGVATIVSLNGAAVAGDKILVRF